MGFIFGQGTDTPTYSALKRKRDIADMLAEQSQQGVVRNGWDGANMIAKTLASKYMDHKLGPQEDAERSRISDVIAGLTGGSGGGSGGGYSGNPASMSQAEQGGFTGAGGAPAAYTAGSPNYADAISGIESGGNYGAQGPEVKGDRAYGKYQVMGANIPDWTQEALGQQLTPEQFLSDPKAQDATFQKKFGGYVDKYGPAGAASMWFSGDPTPDGDSDGYTKDTDYVSKFMASLGGGGGGMGEMMGHQPDMARVGQLADIMSNPYATPGQQMVVKALIDRELKDNSMTPYQMAQLGMDQQRLEDGKRQGVQSFGNVYNAMKDDPTTPENDPKMTPFVTDKAGNVKWLEMGGAEYQPPVSWQDTGTAKVPTFNAGGGPAGAPLAVDNAGKAAATATGDAIGTANATAAVNLPDFELQVRQASDLIDKITQDPAMEHAFGVGNSRLPTVRQSTANLEANVEQLKSQIFPMAIQALKTLGAMSNTEGTTISASIASIDFKRDPKAAAAEFNRVKGVLDQKLEIARQKAAQAQGGGDAAPADWMINSDPSTWTPEQTAEAKKHFNIGQ